MSLPLAPPPPYKTLLGRHRILSPNAAIRVSPLQLGAMSIGEAWSGRMGAMDKQASFALLDAFVEAGGNFIDTANSYQNEQSEIWVGEWMKERGNRDRMVVATKFTAPYRAYAEGKDEAINHSGNSKRSLHVSVRDSLKKLQTDWIDILYLHWWDHTASIEEIMDSLHILVQQGKVLYLGVSNTPAWIVATCNCYARANGKTPFVIYEARWNVIIRDVEREILPMCRQFGMALAPWGAMGGGRFQSKKQMDARKSAGEGIRTTISGSGEQTLAEEKASAVLEKIAQEHGTESLTSVALAYVLSKTPYVFPLIGGRKIEHLHENITALSIKLTDAQIKEIEGANSFEPGYPSDIVGHDPRAGGELNPMLSSQLGTIDIVVGPKALGRQ